MRLPNFEAQEPYPQVNIKEKNKDYAAMMLDNVGGIISEMSAVNSYLYNSVVSKSNGDLSVIFDKIAIVEMRHLKIFSSLAFQLGQDPRIWSVYKKRYKYWSGDLNQYHTNPVHMIKQSLQDELKAADKYQKQAEQIDDPDIKQCLCRIIADEKLHAGIFEAMLKSINK